MSGNWVADLLNSRKQGPDFFGKGRKEGWTNCDKLESRRAGGTRCPQLMPCRLSEIPERHRFPPSTDVGRWVRSCGLSSRSSSESALCAGIWDILYPPVFICMLYAVCCMLDTYESYYNMAMMTSGTTYLSAGGHIARGSVRNHTTREQPVADALYTLCVSSSSFPASD